MYKKKQKITDRRENLKLLDNSNFLVLFVWVKLHLRSLD